MAVENTQLGIEANVEPLITALQKAKAEAIDLANKIIESNRRMKEGFDSVGGSASSMGQQVAQALNKIDAQGKVITALTAELENFKKSGATAFDNSKLDAYKQKIQELETELQKLKVEHKAASDAAAQGNNAQTGSVAALTQKIADQRVQQVEANLQLKEAKKNLDATTKSIDELKSKWGNFIPKNPQLLAELQGLEQKQKDATAAVAKAKDAYQSASANIKQYATEVAKARKEESLHADTAGKSTSIFSTLKEKLLALLPSIKPVASGLKEVGNESEAVKKKAEEIGGTFEKLKGYFDRAAERLLAFFAVEKIVEFGNRIFEAVQNLEKLQTQLTQALGSNSEAQKALSQISEFAKKTPFDIDQVTAAYVSLAQKGFIPTKEQLKQMGDLAASQGKNFNDLAAALESAQLGNLRALHEFGIQAVKTNDGVTLSFGGVTKKVKDTSAAITQAVVDFGKLPQAAGAMDRLTDTVGGGLQKLKNGFTELVTNIGIKLLPVFKRIIGGATEIVDFLGGIFSNKAPAAVQPIIDGFKTLYDGVETTVTSLLKFVGLDTSLENLKTTFGKLSDAIGVITTAAGNLLKVFSQIFLESNKTGSGGLFKPLTDQINEVLDGVNQMPFEFAGAQAAVNQFVQNAKNYFRGLEIVVDTIGLKIKKAFTVDEQAKQKLQKQINDLKSEYTRLEQAPTPSEAYDKAYAAAKAAADAKKKAAAETKPEITDDSTVKGRPTGPVFDPEADARLKALAERQKKEDEARLQRLQQIADLEKQLAQARIDAMEEGRKKEIAIENARYKAAVDTLEVLRAQANVNLKTDSAANKKRDLEQIALINQNEEVQQQTHRDRLQLIDKKYYKEAADALKVANRSINNLILDNEQKELADLDERTDTTLKAIEDARKKLQAVAGSPVEVVLIETLATKKSQQVITESLEESNTIIHNSYQKRLDEEKDLAAKSVDIIQNSSISEKSMTELKEHLKLDIEKEYASKRLRNLTDEYKLQGVITQDAIKKLSDPKNILAAKKEGVDIFDFLGIKITGKDDEEILKVKKAILELLGILNQIQKFSSLGDILQNILKIDDTDIQKLQKLDAFKSAFNAINSLVSEAAKSAELATQRRIAAIDKEISKINDLIQVQQERVDTEKALADKGLANNLAVEQARLNFQKDALNQETAAKEDQEKKLVKIQKEQALLQSESIAAQSLVQSANMITTVTALFKSNAPLGLPGVLLSIAAVATLLTAFLAIKNSIKSATQNAAGFEKGGKYDLYEALDKAPSHREGGAGLYNEKTGEKLAEFEGKEKLFIVNKGSAQKYEPVLNAINEDTLSTWSIDRLKGLIRPVDIRFWNENNQNRFFPEERKTTVIHYHNQPHISTEHLERIAKSNEQIAETNKQLLELEVNAERIIELDDRIIYIQGNRTRIVNKKKQG